MSTITKQWLQQKIADMEAARDEIPFGLDEDDSNTLAALRIALASLEAEPVCIIDQTNLDYLKSGADADVWPASRAEMGDVLLYRAAPPAPVSVPDGYRLQPISEYDAMCAAMFRGADGYSPDGWVACSERMPETMVSVLVTGTWFHHAVAFWDGLSWCDLDFEPPVTHWMPLPAAPQKEVKP